MTRNLRLVLLLFAVTSIYLFLRADPTLFYYGMVGAHVAGGVAFTIWALVMGPRVWRALRGAGRAAFLALLAGSLAGCALVVTGNLRPMKALLVSHEVLAGVGTLGLLLAGRASAGGREARGREVLVASAAAALVMVGAAVERDRRFVVENPVAPASMDGEVMGGASGPFHPSSIHTSTGDRIPSTFFMTSESCGKSDCHPDSFREWQSSAHRFSSFNNQFYRKSIEYMQDVVGVEPSRWCAGCHDVAVLLNGMFDRPVQEILDTPEAQVGLACTACHAMVTVRSTMGNGDYEIEYPPLHDLSASKNPVLEEVHDFLIKMDPEPHRKTFLKPFHEKQHSEFCSTCHKVHLDEPVNAYRWFRGFNEYDPWQASGVSHQGARSFYAPDKPMDCVTCHMPVRETAEAGAEDGVGHSHRFAAANTALPTVNQDPEQLQAVKDFITSRAVTVDVFAASLAPRPVEPSGAAVPASAAQNFFGAGEEEAMGGPGEAVSATDFDAMLAPLDRVKGPVLPRGGSVRLDVVVRTTGMGHMFPGGTVDAFDVWVELQGVDADGRTIFWSGAVEDGGKGPVEKGAHVYRALLVDGAGNAINKRNAWTARAMVYARLIPPGAADVAHFRVDVAPDVKGPVTFTARVNHRKFSHFYTEFSYAMQRDPSDTNPDKTPHYDNGRFVKVPVPANVSGKVKEIPELPILTLAESQVTLQVAEAADVTPSVILQPEDKIRWNDYGIGLFLQRDLKGAAGAWERVTTIDASYADGWVNRARAAVDEGRLADADELLAKALALKPGFPKAHYFRALSRKARGDLDGALADLRVTLASFPKDRVVRNEAGRVLFLLRRYAESVAELEQTLLIDPEDVQAHYNLMLSHRALGQEEAAARSQALYLRFKADEASQALTGKYLREHPEDNNERQRIHEHVSIPLGGPGLALTGAPDAAGVLPDAGGGPGAS